MTTRTASRRPSVPGAASAVTRGVLLLAVLAAVPWALITLAPIPLPGTGRLRDLAREWTSDPGPAAGGMVSAISQMLRQPITDQLIVQILAFAVWLIWAAFVLCLLAEAGSLASGIPAPHLPGLGGLQSAASWLLTGTLAGLLASSAVLPHPVAGPSSPAPAAASMMTAPETTATALITPSYRHVDELVYVVEPGDWLGAIAQRFLGDSNAYDVLQRANPGLIPDTAGPHGPDHIEPGWHLILPRHARDRGPDDHATGTTTAKRPAPSEPSEANGGASAGGTGASGGTRSQDSSPSANPVTTPPSPTASAGPPGPTAGPLAAPAAGASSAPATETSGGANDHDSSHDGAQFGDGWISWPLAASLAAVAALVWMARRRRYRYTEPFSYPGQSDPTGDDDDGVFDGGNYPDGADNEAQFEHQDTPGARDVAEAARLEDLNDLTSLGGVGGVDEGDAESTPLYWSIRHPPPGQAAGHPEDEGAARRGRPARRVARADRIAAEDDADDEDLRPMPAALNRIRLLVQAHSAALTDPQPTSPLTPPQSHRAGSGAGHDGSPDRTTAPDAGGRAASAAGTSIAPAPGYSIQEPATAAASGLPAIGPSGAQLAGLRDIPPEGAGLTGPGAEDAARALLVSALTAGGPADPDAAGIVVTTFDTLNTLIGGPAAVNVEGIPRLQIAGDLDAALSIVDDHILTRRRTLDEHDESDLLRLREEQPWSAPMPPVLLLTHAPPATAGPIKARLSTSLHLGSALQITGVLLGDWPRGQTVHVNASGHASIHTPGTDTRPDQPADPARRNETRLAVMGIAATVELLAALGEAQTGQPMTLPATATTAPAAPPPAPALDSGTPEEPAGLAGPSGPADESALTRKQIPADGFGPAGADPAPIPAAGHEPVQLEVHTGNHPAGGAPPVPVSQPSGLAGPLGDERIRLRVLGAPMVLDRDGHPVPGLRSGAIQVLTILAVHRDGHPLKDIMEKMWPDAPVRRAADRLSTEAANLRRTVRIAMGRPDDRTPATNAVINTGSYYILNENLVEIDLWQLQDLINAAKDTSDPAARIGLLQAAIAAHAGPLADGRDYPWADVARHQIQRHGIRARLHLAQLIAEDDPSEAARIVTQAADADPVSEDLAQRAIRACAAAGDADGARARLRTLRAALEEIDQEPTAETLALAANLTIAKPTARPSGPPGFPAPERPPDARPPAPDGQPGESGPAARHDRKDIG